MRWIAPAVQDIATNTLERRLWAAADQFRAKSGLKAQEYSVLVLGLIFQRFADVRFAQLRSRLERATVSSRGGCRVDDPVAYHAEGILYLPAAARFDFLLHLPEAANMGTKVNEIMREMEKHNAEPAGVLPKRYNFLTSRLLKGLLKMVSEIPAIVDYDAFGCIYEHFFGMFARTEGQKGGEFYTPFCTVRRLTERNEPSHGRILDPACGSGVMLVQSARFLSEHEQDSSAELAIHGVKKTDETSRPCCMNPAVDGLEGDMHHGGQVNSCEGLFEELLTPSRGLSVEQERNVRENQTEKGLLVFDILTRPAPELSLGERDEVKKVARALLVRINGVLVLNWRQKASARSSVKLTIEDVLDQGLPLAYDKPLFERKCGALFENFYEVYPDLGRGVFAEAC